MPEELKLSRQEQETIIRCSALDHEWEVVTADPRIIRKMQRQGYKPENRKNPWGYFSFSVPFGRISILRLERRKATGKPFVKRQENPTDHAQSREIPDQNAPGNG